MSWCKICELLEPTRYQVLKKGKKQALKPFYMKELKETVDEIRETHGQSLLR